MQLKKSAGMKPNKNCSISGNTYEIPVSLRLKGAGMNNLEEYLVKVINHFSLLKRFLSRESLGFFAHDK